MVLAALGEKGLAEYVDHQIELTRQAYEYIRHLPGFTCAVEPQCNILCFRIDGDDDLLLRIRDALDLKGDFYISTTLFNGIRFLRLSIMNPNTTMDNIKGLIPQIKEICTK